MNLSVPVERLWATHPDALVLVLDGVVVDTNPSTQQLYGYRRSWLVGRPADLLAPPDHLVPGGTRSLFRAQRVDGRSFVASTSVIQENEPGGPTLVVVRDLSPVLGWLNEREQALDASRETITQHLYGVGIELASCLEQDGDVSRERVERALDVLDNTMRSVAADR